MPILCRVPSLKMKTNKTRAEIIASSPKNALTWPRNSCMKSKRTFGPCSASHGTNCEQGRTVPRTASDRYSQRMKTPQRNQKLRTQASDAVVQRSRRNHRAVHSPNSCQAAGSRGERGCTCFRVLATSTCQPFAAPSIIRASPVQWTSRIHDGLRDTAKQILNQRREYNRHEQTVTHYGFEDPVRGCSPWRRTCNSYACEPTKEPEDCDSCDDQADRKRDS